MERAKPFHLPHKTPCKSYSHSPPSPHQRLQTPLQKRTKRPWGKGQLTMTLMDEIFIRGTGGQENQLMGEIDGGDGEGLLDFGFMELLGCDDAVLSEKRVETHTSDNEGFYFSSSSRSSTSCSSSSSSSAHMLHFGGGAPHVEILIFHGGDQSIAPTAAPSSRSRGRASSKKMEGDGGRRGGSAAALNTGTLAANNRKIKGQVVRKEKLGERISVLQQLVSPFGKSDTATVLHEAIGYIRFLHDQVQVLSSPYLQQLPSLSHQDGEGGDLRSRGLCLVPVSCTEAMANSSNSVGADLWSPTKVGGSKH